MASYMDIITKSYMGLAAAIIEQAEKDKLYMREDVEAFYSSQWGIYIKEVATEFLCDESARCRRKLSGRLKALRKTVAQKTVAEHEKELESKRRSYRKIREEEAKLGLYLSDYKPASTSKTKRP